MTVENRLVYGEHRAARDQAGASPFLSRELWLTILLFGSIGAITWAIRGTTGWGGIDGTLVPGLTWGLLWYYLCWKRGIDARGVALWLGLSIAIGGELGYGQYTSWIRGTFMGPDGPMPLSPWVGCLWLFICGTGWGATGGIALGWVLGEKVSPARWLVRLCVPVLVALLGWQLVRIWPNPFFPYYGSGIYNGELGKHLGRTVFTNTQNFAVFAWWFGAMLVAVFQKDKATLVAGSVLGAGFGVTFMLSTMWCLGYAYAPDYIDWWKLWELSAGFFLGAQYALVMYWAIRRVDAAHAPDGAPLRQPRTAMYSSEVVTSVLWCASCCLLVLASGLEYFPVSAVLLGILFVVPVCIATFGPGAGGQPELVRERRHHVTLIFAALALLFILLHGASSRAGVFLGLYDGEAVDQYEWPRPRAVLYAAALVPVLGVILVKLWKAAGKPLTANPPAQRNHALSIRMLELLTFIGAVGAVSIWPAKIGVLYAVALAFAVSAFFRLEQDGKAPGR